jgi:hypothetical protein
MKTTIGMLLVALVGGVCLPRAAIGQEAPKTNLPRQTRITCPWPGSLLILSGGGIRGAYQAGAVWYMTHKLGCTFDHIYGTSTGAVSAAFLAQADELPALQKLSDDLVENYKVTSTTDIIEPRFLGTLRVFLPRAFGGVDGINTLDPLARRLKDQIDPKKIRNLTVLAVSLQGGPIRISVGGDGEIYSRYVPDDIREFVLGSSSVPVAVEPRRVRLWMHGAVVKFAGDLLTFLSHGIGLPDPACEVRFDQLVLPCEHVHSAKERVDPADRSSQAEWRIVVRLPRLRPEDRSRMEEIIAEADPEIPADVQVSTIHQLIDGGVTENIQLEDIDEILGLTDSDYVIVLTTGELRAKATSAEEVRGGMNIALASFEHLWENYQEKSVSSALAEAYYRPYLAAARRQLRQAESWRDELRNMLGEEEFQRLESRMQTPYPEPSPSFQKALETSVVSQAPIFHIFTPDARIFTGTFAADLASINTALYYGCAMVANYAKNGKKEDGSEPDEFDSLRFVRTRGGGNAECEPLLKPAKSYRAAFEDELADLLASGSRLSFDELKRLSMGSTKDKLRWCAVLTTYSYQAVDHAAEAINECRALADSGNAMGLYLLGRAYERGRGVTANLAEAARLYERAIVKDLPHALVALGYLFKEGRGVPKNADRALVLFGRAADKGYPAAFNALGEVRREATPDGQASKEAMAWFRKAAAAGYRQGVENMMRLVQDVPQD